MHNSHGARGPPGSSCAWPSTSGRWSATPPASPARRSSLRRVWWRPRSSRRPLRGATASLGVIASPFVYETVIRHGRDPDYTQVPVEVKESNTAAWMKLFGRLMSPPLAPHPGAPESYLGPLAGCAGVAHEASRRSRRVRAFPEVGLGGGLRASARDSQRSWACSFSARAASGARVAMK